MQQLPPPNIDIAVLLVFFNRPSTFKLVFDEVRKARPSRLFLYQDGPRSDADKPGIEECRKIATDIDWQCDVRTCFQERNYGCDPSGFMAHRWAFTLADKCMVLEDDVVPSQSFFPFCKEMLDRYEHDERITMIAGFNTDEQTADMPYSYFFTSAFSIWGWASWRRVVERWDEKYTFLDDPYTARQLAELAKERHQRADFMKMCRNHKANGKPYFESIFWSRMLMDNGLAVMPAVNLINNVGATADSTHYSELQTMPKALRRIFTMRRLELQFPLRHPKYIMESVGYRQRLYRRNAWGHPWVKVGRSFEELWYNLVQLNFGYIAKMAKRRLLKTFGLLKHK